MERRGHSHATKLASVLTTAIKVLPEQSNKRLPYGWSGSGTDHTYRWRPVAWEADMARRVLLCIQRDCDRRIVARRKGRRRAVNGRADWVEACADCHTTKTTAVFRAGGEPNARNLRHLIQLKAGGTVQQAGELPEAH